jgi:hypothetical protein
MATPYLTIRPGHPDFLDLPWDQPLLDWEHPRLVELPTGIHRHPVRFVAYRDDIYAIKELPRSLARHELQMLRTLLERGAPTVYPVGVVERSWLDPHTEGAGVVITKYLQFSFPYRELVSGGGFGERRTQMLDTFAVLLVDLHLAGCFWGDCSLSNVLLRYDAAALQAWLVDAETVRLYDELTEGQRREDLDIMILNVAGGMADIAASQELDLDDADLGLGEDIAERYHGLWSEVTRDEVIGPDERFRISDRLQRLNELGFEVENVELAPVEDGHRLRLNVKVGGRHFHSQRLWELTRIEATENQARQILSDLYYYEAELGPLTEAGRAVAAIQWRTEKFEPRLTRMRELRPPIDPVQSYCDFLHHRYAMSLAAGYDVGSEVAFDDWVAAGFPGYKLD